MSVMTRLEISQRARKRSSAPMAAITLLFEALTLALCQHMPFPGVAPRL